MRRLLRELGNVPVMFWTCPVRGHSDSDRHNPRQTVEWRDGVAHCLTPGCGRTSDNPIPDDGRTWWIVGADTWTGVQIYEARNGRAALAAYRRDLFEAERANKRTVRDARDLIDAANLHVVVGPIGTRQAYEFDLARAYADELERWRDFIIIVATDPGPDTVDELGRQIVERYGADTAARIRDQVRADYLPRSEG